MTAFTVPPCWFASEAYERLATGYRRILPDVMCVMLWSGTWCAEHGREELSAFYLERSCGLLSPLRRERAVAALVATGVWERWGAGWRWRNWSYWARPGAVAGSLAVAVSDRREYERARKAASRAKAREQGASVPDTCPGHVPDMSRKSPGHVPQESRTCPAEEEEEEVVGFCPDPTPASMRQSHAPVPDTCPGHVPDRVPPDARDRANLDATLAEWLSTMTAPIDPTSQHRVAVCRALWMLQELARRRVDARAAPLSWSTVPGGPCDRVWAAVRQYAPATLVHVLRVQTTEAELQTDTTEPLRWLNGRSNWRNGAIERAAARDPDRLRREAAGFDQGLSAANSGGKSPSWTDDDEREQRELLAVLDRDGGAQ